MKMGCKPVSVVIPCRNRAGFLKETLANLMGQLRHDDQVIVVDNGSNDGLQSMLEKHFMPPVEVVPLPYEDHWMRNKALNTGIEAAANDLIIVLDADTVPQPRCIDLLREAAGRGVYVSGLIAFKVPREVQVLTEGRGLRGEVALMGTSPPEKVVGNVREGRVQEVMGACLCFHREDWRRVGGYTEAYDGHWGLAETDYYLKLHYAGVRMVALNKFNPVQMTGCIAVHIDNITHTKPSVTKRRLRDKEINRKLLLSLIPLYIQGIFNV